MLLGGVRYKEQSFQPIAARLNASSMNLAVIAILLPTAVQYTSSGFGARLLQQFSVAVAVVLILVVIGQPMDLDFNPFELVAVAVSVLTANSISSDGKSNWLEGTLLLSTYTILGLAFYFHPVEF